MSSRGGEGTVSTKDVLPESDIVSLPSLTSVPSAGSVTMSSSTILFDFCVPPKNIRISVVASFRFFGCEVLGAAIEELSSPPVVPP